ncbi:hypothetical protein DLM76_00830 [Leptospira yasudae]|uniref:Uncharacterized protein n=1 Tax=Leptospira yasudae TaxID=2202201 RepID=A0ABX9M3G3_9LEPT|nr:hypothetical protein DLM77_12230 [Leptospira yasudae]RHX95571.1 hypothetical protein DLM76_00830 [Leptospira yasudae]
MKTKKAWIVVNMEAYTILFTIIIAAYSFNKFERLKRLTRKMKGVYAQKKHRSHSIAVYAYTLLRCPLKKSFCA